MLFIEAFLESVIHCIDGGLALLVAIHGVDIGFLDKEKNQKQRGKDGNNSNL